MKPRIDLILNDNDGNPFFFIEVKDPDKFEADKIHIEGQLFKLAALHTAESGKAVHYLVYYTAEVSAGTIIDKAIIIDRAAYPTYSDWVAAGEPSIGNAIPLNYNKPRKEALTRRGTRDLSNRFTAAEVNALATNLHNVLWGGGSTGDTEVFSALVNIILAKIQDEYDTSDGAEYKFQVFQHGDELEKPEELFLRINALYRSALRHQLNKTGDLNDQWVVNKEKFSLSKLLFTVQQLEKYSFVDGKNSLTGKDILGDFFEQIQREGFKQTKGQFFTPGTIVRFMLYALELDELSIALMNTEHRLPFIIDPSCGSATFLIEAMKLITDELKRRRRSSLITSRMVTQRYDELFTPDYHEHRWAREYLYGIEHNFELATASKVNMILHGDGSTNIFQQDGLKPFRFFQKSGGTNALSVTSPSPVYKDREVNEQFDVVISNPPFSVSLDDDTKRFLVSEFMFGKRKNSENLFLERYWQLLRPGGRMAIVLPESVFDTTENRYIRLFLFAYFDVVAVVSLPKISFEPYTQTKTSVLFARKKSAKAIEQWWAAWRASSSSYQKLRTRVENYRKVFINGEKQSKFPSIAGDGLPEVVANLQSFLKIELTKDDLELEAKPLLEKYAVLIEETSQTDGDQSDPFGMVNVHWVFRDTSANDEKSIFIAEAGAVGYKRTKRGVKVQPNDLFRVEGAPTALDLAAVRSAIGARSGGLAADLASVQARIDVLSLKNRKTARDNDQIEKLNARRLVLEAQIAALQLQLTDYEANVFSCYEAGQLKPEHHARDTHGLRDAFAADTLRPWWSDEVVTHAENPVGILENMRASKVWS